MGEDRALAAPLTAEQVAAIRTPDVPLNELPALEPDGSPSWCVRKLRLCSRFVPALRPENPGYALYVAQAAQLLDLQKYLTGSGASLLSWTSLYGEIIAFVRGNLLSTRSVPRPQYENVLWDPAEDTQRNDASWPVLSPVYTIFATFLAQRSVDCRTLERVLTRHMLGGLVQLLDVDDCRERDYLKFCLNRLYVICPGHRRFFVTRLIDALAGAAERGHHAGLSDVLELLRASIAGAGISSLQIPLRRLLVSVVLPLCTLTSVATFIDQLTALVAAVVSCEASLVAPALRRLLQLWPIHSAASAMHCLQLMAELLPRLRPQDFDAALARRVSRCLALSAASGHAAMADVVFDLIEQPPVYHLMASQRVAVYQMLLPALASVAYSHWCPTTLNRNAAVLRHLQLTDPSLFRSTMDSIEERAGQARESREAAEAAYAELRAAALRVATPAGRLRIALTDSCISVRHPLDPWGAVMRGELLPDIDSDAEAGESGRLLRQGLQTIQWPETLCPFPEYLPAGRMAHLQEGVRFCDPTVSPLDCEPGKRPSRARYEAATVSVAQALLQCGYASILRPAGLPLLWHSFFPRPAVVPRLVSTACECGRVFFTGPLDGELLCAAVSRELQSASVFRTAITTSFPLMATDTEGELQLDEAEARRLGLLPGVPLWRQQARLTAQPRPAVQLDWRVVAGQKIKEVYAHGRPAIPRTSLEDRSESYTDESSIYQPGHVDSQDVEGAGQESTWEDISDAPY